MATTEQTTRRDGSKPHLPKYLFHHSFQEGGAGARFHPEEMLELDQKKLGYMPDELTRDTTKRMHYAAFRADTANTPSSARRWVNHYHRLRDEVVLGNRKLVFKAVRSKMSHSNLADDLIGECDIVLIQVVAAFNPWIGVRFSTYAYTCLARALSRMSKRLVADRLTQSIPIDLLPEGHPQDQFESEPAYGASHQLDEYFRADHPLLSAREKLVLRRRYRDENDLRKVQTLETVGHELGLSKERVRQVQATAIDKLRAATTAQS